LIRRNYVIEEINKLAGGEATISNRCWPTPDGGAQYCDFPPTAPVVDVPQHGTMGLACRPPSAPRSPNPRRLVIDIDGDSSIRMNMGELENRHDLRPAREGRRVE